MWKVKWNMISELTQDRNYQLREQAIFMVEECMSIQRRMLILRESLASLKQIQREPLQTLVMTLQQDTLQILNMLNSMQLEINQ